MLINSDRRFLLQLSLALKVPIQELEQYPASVIQEYKALNIVSPFINDSKLAIEGFKLETHRNQNVSKKKDYRTAEQLLPFLSKYPEHLEHETIKKVNNLLNVCLTEEAKTDLLTKISEEIEQEHNKEDPDLYLIHRLSEIYLNNYNNKGCFDESH
ncbi:TPA: hypothetical protein ACPVXB_001018 [Vibrio parahaemolyticus]